MKPAFRSSREVLAEIDRVLAATPAQWRNSPLDEVAGILSRARSYASVAIYVVVNGGGGREPTANSGAPLGTAKAAIRKGRRLLGVIEAAGPRVGRRDQFLLKEVAARLAVFLTSNGKWLVRKVREAAAAAEAPGAQHAAGGR